MDEMQLFENAERNSDFFEENFKRFESEHPNKFIAISEGKFVGSSTDSDSILDLIKEKNIDNSNVLIEFVPMAGTILVL